MNHTEKADDIKDGPMILALDTTSQVTALTLARGGRIIATRAEELDEKRSEKLWDEAARLLAEAGVEFSGIDLFAVCTGPGGFTGLRVGVAAAKGYAQAAGRPVVGVTSLETVAFAVGPADRVSVMLNAYRGDVYSQSFRFDPEGVPVALADPVMDTPAGVTEKLDGAEGIVFAGEGAAANLELLKGVPGGKVRQPDGPLSEYVARLGFLKWLRGETETASSLRAVYVRPADAEIKLARGLVGVGMKQGPLVRK